MVAQQLGSRCRQVSQKGRKEGRKEGRPVGRFFSRKEANEVERRQASRKEEGRFVNRKEGR